MDHSDKLYACSWWKPRYHANLSKLNLGFYISGSSFPAGLVCGQVFCRAIGQDGRPSEVTRWGKLWAAMLLQYLLQNFLRKCPKDIKNIYFHMQRVLLMDAPFPSLPREQVAYFLCTSTFILKAPTFNIKNIILQMINTVLPWQINKRSQHFSLNCL